VFGAHLRRYRAALLQTVTHVVGALLCHHKAALLQHINHGFDAIFRQDKAALLQPKNHGFWRHPLASIPDCSLAANKPHNNAHLRRYRTALLRSETNLQTPISCPVNGLPSCNEKTHHPRLPYLLSLGAALLHQVPAYSWPILGQPSCCPNQPTQTSKHGFCVHRFWAALLQPKSTLLTATNLLPLGGLLHQVFASLRPN
jgi:hypothetical protein